MCGLYWTKNRKPSRASVLMQALLALILWLLQSECLKFRLLTKTTRLCELKMTSLSTSPKGAAYQAFLLGRLISRYHEHTTKSSMELDCRALKVLEQVSLCLLRSVMVHIVGNWNRLLGFRCVSPTRSMSYHCTRQWTHPSSAHQKTKSLAFHATW